jgi:DNA-binding MarR family transcriptional regulator
MAVRPVRRAAEPCDVIQDGRGDLDPAAVPGPGQRILGVKAAGLPPLEWYDALLEIGRAGADGLRPMVLDARLLLPQFGVSRLRKRLEGEGLMQTRPAPDDRRGTVVAITAARRAMRQRIWPVHAAAQEDVVAARIAPEERAPLPALLARLG